MTAAIAIGVLIGLIILWGVTGAKRRSRRSDRLTVLREACVRAASNTARAYDLREEQKRAIVEDRIHRRHA